MLGWLAALCFAIAFIFNGAGFDHGARLSPGSFMLLGLTLLALHLVGVGTGITVLHRRAPGE